MKMVHKEIDKQIDFAENPIWRLIIEEPTEFYKLVSELNRQMKGEDGCFVLSESGNMLELEKSCLLIYDFYNFSLNNAKTDKLISTHIINIMREMDIIQPLVQMNKSLIEINDKILENIGLPITFEAELTIEKLVKISEFSIEEEQTLLGKILTYIDIMIELKNIKCVVFVGIEQVLSFQDIETLIREMKYKNICLLLIESRESGNSLDIGQIIVDKDLCII